MRDKRLYLTKSILRKNKTSKKLELDNVRQYFIFIHNTFLLKNVALRKL